MSQGDSFRIPRRSRRKLNVRNVVTRHCILSLLQLRCCPVAAWLYSLKITPGEKARLWRIRQENQVFQMRELLALDRCLAEGCVYQLRNCVPDDFDIVGMLEPVSHHKCFHLNFLKTIRQLMTLKCGVHIDKHQVCSAASHL